MHDSRLLALIKLLLRFGIIHSCCALHMPFRYFYTAHTEQWTRSLMSNSTSMTSIQTISCNFGILDCGVHGLLTPPCSCVCDAGWSTDANQDFSNYKYCNVTTAALEDSWTNTIFPGPPPVSNTPPPDVLVSSLGGLPWYMWVTAVAGLLLAIAVVLILAAKHRLDVCWRCITNPLWKGIRQAKQEHLPHFCWKDACTADGGQSKQIRERCHHTTIFEDIILPETDQYLRT